MRKLPRAIWLVTLCAFMSGCTATYRNAALPGEIPENDPSAQAPMITAGQSVRLTLLSGQVLTGRVVSVTSESLEIRSSKIGGPKNLEVEIADIDHIEVQETRGAKTATYVILGLVAVAGILYLGSIGNSVGD